LVEDVVRYYNDLKDEVEFNMTKFLTDLEEMKDKKQQFGVLAKTLIEFRKNGKNEIKLRVHSKTNIELPKISNLNTNLDIVELIRNKSYNRSKSHRTRIVNLSKYQEKASGLSPKLLGKKKTTFSRRSDSS
jgi:hypothetical protein